MKTYLETFAVVRLKPSTRHSYRMWLESTLLPQLGDHRIDRIGAIEVDGIDALLIKRGVSRATRGNAQVVLRSILCRFCVERDLLPDRPKLPK
ncbi:MAG: hypothetical protein WCJ30_06115, partial [Deltaproteobacteria bacterium]